MFSPGVISGLKSLFGPKKKFRTANFVDKKKYVDSKSNSTLIPSEAIPAQLTFNLGDSPIFQIFSKNFGEI